MAAVVVVDDGVLADALVDLHEPPMEGHEVGLEAPVLAAGEVRGQDAPGVAGVLGLVVEARGQDAQLLQDLVDAEDIGYGERQDPEAYQSLRDGEGLVEAARRGDVAEAQSGDRGPAEVERLAQGRLEAPHGQREVPAPHAVEVDQGVPQRDEEDPDRNRDRHHERGGHREPEGAVPARQRAGEEARDVEEPAVEADAHEPEAVVVEHRKEDVEYPREDQSHAGR